VRFVRATYRREGVSVSYEAAGDVAVTVRFGELEHILLNLLHNAARSVEALPAGAERKVWVRARRVGDEVSLEVEDSGPGIAPDALGALFRPAVSSSGGTGLGLFIARSLAERNGGVLDYEPSGGRSLFRLSLPV
jgi:signal transduction histidine kinase